jgi:hypothetical protein
MPPKGRIGIFSCSLHIDCSKINFYGRAGARPSVLRDKRQKKTTLGLFLKAFSLEFREFVFLILQ